MNSESINDTLIAIPSFLAGTTYAVSRASDCGSCQSSVESCGSNESGSCSSCEGFGCEGSEGCSESCSESCDEGCLCLGGQGEYPCSQACAECSVCEDCMDCESSCQISCQTCMTNGQQTNISPWSWSSSNGSATAAQTAAAYRAITNNGPVSNFSYVVWNDLVSKVHNVLSASNGSWNSKYAVYSATLIHPSDRTLTATKFNSLRYNVGLRASTGIAEVSSGDTVYGSYFITITNALNTWIDSASS